jgi:hypothetical protein
MESYGDFTCVLHMHARNRFVNQCTACVQALMSLLECDQADANQAIVKMICSGGSAHLGYEMTPVATFTAACSCTPRARRRAAAGATRDPDDPRRALLLAPRLPAASRVRQVLRTCVLGSGAVSRASDSGHRADCSASPAEKDSTEAGGVH